MKKIIHGLILVALVAAAAPSFSKTDTGKAVDPYWNDLARFLAGLPQRQESSFLPLTGLDVYTQHASAMEWFWTLVKKENEGFIIPWRTQYVPSRVKGTMGFYPFSGADFINLYTFYPDCPSYLMMALEEPGAIPEPLKLNANELAYGLQSVQRAISTIASQNYLQSGIMAREMANKYIEGVTPSLLIFVARLGFTVTDVSLVGIGPKGDVEPLDAQGLIGGSKPAVYGSRIMFMVPGETAARSLVYLKARLHNSILAKGTPEGKFFDKMKHMNMITKSAVYLLHTEWLLDVARHFMDRSDIIIQDDSAIPYRYFDPAQWEILLFGTYSAPVALSDLPNPPQQPDLAYAYSIGSTPLAFNFGYGVWMGRGKSNLLRAVRKSKGKE
ncbi:MAG: hypothetical protein EPN93_15465 [Spirochaetes bacterium]|nr:MAG: hypothetical protein EPN93_15465 [Spirochaetota bacterium]